MIINTTSGNKSAKSITVQTASGPKKALAVWVMTASGLERESFESEPSIAGIVSTLAPTVSNCYDVCGYGGSLYITNNSSDYIYKLDLTTESGSIFTYGEEDNNFSNLKGICEYQGILYVCDGSEIWAVNIATKVTTLFAGQFISGDTLGVGTTAQFDNPTGICAHDGFLYVTDTGNNKIKKIEISTATVTHLAGSGTSGSTDGSALVAEFPSSIGGIEYSDGFVYVTGDLGSTSKIRKVDITTGLTSTFTSRSAQNTDTNGLCSYLGKLYNTENPINSANDNGLVEYDLSSGLVTNTIGGQSAGFGDSPSPSFNKPIGLCEHEGAIYVCDSGNSKIRKIV